MAEIVDSYDSDQSYQPSVGNGIISGLAQTFTGDGGTLNSCAWYLKKSGSPSFNLTAKIYAITGTSGTNGKPTGSALATSGTVAASSLATSYVKTTFTFAGDDKITLGNGTNYCVSIEGTGGDTSNYVSVAADLDPSTDDGNRSIYNGSWISFSTHDMNFFVYKDGTAPEFIPKIMIF